MSKLPLASAAGRASLRRAVQAASARRVLSAVATLALVAAIGVGFRAGIAIGGLLAPTLADPAVARALAAGLALVGLGSGVALGVTLPGLPGLGPGLACAPAGAVDRVLAILGPPVCLTTAGTSVAALPLAAPIAAAGPAGAASTPALAASLLAATVVGGAVSTLGRDIRSLVRRGRSSAPIAAIVLALALVPSAMARAGDALAGRGSAAMAVGLSATVTSLALAGWGCLAVRPTPKAGGRGRSRALGGPAGRAVALAALLLLARRADVRAALVGGAVLGALGLGIARVAGAPAPSGLLLAVTGAALTAAPCPLAIGGILGAGRHVWRLAPIGAATMTVAWLAAAALGLLPSLALAPIAALVEGGAIADLGVALGVALVVWSCALLAGSIVPWRPQGIVDQALSLAVTGAAVGGVSLAASRVGPVLVDAGLPAPLAGTAVVGAVTLVGAAGLLGAVRDGR